MHKLKKALNGSIRRPLEPKTRRQPPRIRCLDTASTMPTQHDHPSPHPKSRTKRLNGPQASHHRCTSEVRHVQLTRRELHLAQLVSQLNSQLKFTAGRRVLETGVIRRCRSRFLKVVGRSRQLALKYSMKPHSKTGKWLMLALMGGNGAEYMYTCLCPVDSVDNFNIFNVLILWR